MHNMSPVAMILILAAILGVLFLVVILLVWILTWIVGKIGGFHAPFSYFAWTWLALLLVTAASLSYGYYIGRWRVKVTNMEYLNADIPASFDGYRVVHISDLHLGSFEGADDKLERFVESINAQNPDLICFTGDLVTMDPSEIRPRVDILRHLKAKDGVVSVLGNHDFLIYSRHDSLASQRSLVDGLSAMERELLGWNLLRNEHYTINRDNDSISIIGVDNQHCSNQGFETIANGDLQSAMAGVSGFSILLSHDPSHWTGEVLPATDIPLTLSGHTHNGQVSFFGWSPCSLVFKETAGRYDRDGQTLYINIGLGTTAPFRIGARPEVTVITLKSK